MKILITGICGFVGSTLARLWSEAEPGITIFGIDNLIRPGSHTNLATLKNRGVKVFHGDIRMPSDFETLPPVDFVIDAAANPSVLAGLDGRSSSRQVVEHNLVGTMNMLEYCKAARAGFILISTSRVYAIAPLTQLVVESVDEAFRPVATNDWPAGLSAQGVAESFSTSAPVSLYGSTKIASEALALEYGSAFDFPVWINRCGVLAGAGQFGHAEQGIFSFWLHSWRSRRPLKYIGFGGNGHQVRDALHPADLLAIMRKEVAFTSTPERRIFNLSGGADNAMSLAQLSRWCRNRWGEHPVSPQPSGRRYDIPWMVLDSSNARQFWNWQPAITLGQILEEIARFSEQNPGWLDIAGN
jgi:CDP-paratose 2-epimerase